MPAEKPQYKTIKVPLRSKEFYSRMSKQRKVHSGGSGFRDPAILQKAIATRKRNAQKTNHSQTPPAPDQTGQPDAAASPPEAG